MSYLNDNTHSNRHGWEFDYTARDLAKAAQTKADYRESREKWWVEAQAKVMTEVKASGIEVSESIAQAYSNSGRGPQVMVRADLQTSLVECHNKIQEHNQAAWEYRGWIAVLEANPEARLKLRHSDWLYFFGDDAVLTPEEN